MTIGVILSIPCIIVFVLCGKNLSISLMLEDDYEKVKYVYDYLGNKNTYGDIHDINGPSAYSAFSDTLSPVCACYAKASQILFRNIGINSLLIFGDAKYNLFIGDAHA